MTGERPYTGLLQPPFIQQGAHDFLPATPRPARPSLTESGGWTNQMGVETLRAGPCGCCGGIGTALPAGQPEPAPHTPWGCWCTACGHRQSWDTRRERQHRPQPPGRSRLSSCPRPLVFGSLSSCPHLLSAPSYSQRLAHFYSVPSQFSAGLGPPGAPHLQSGAPFPAQGHLDICNVTLGPYRGISLETSLFIRSGPFREACEVSWC